MSVLDAIQERGALFRHVGLHHLVGSPLSVGIIGFLQSLFDLLAKPLIVRLGLKHGVGQNLTGVRGLVHNRLGPDTGHHPFARALQLTELPLDLGGLGNLHRRAHAHPSRFAAEVLHHQHNHRKRAT